jgi:CoA:oxalate CoA-transferase
MTTPSPYPLAGITVVDLSQIYNGPYATFLMAQAGADVIKVEPKGGEHLRRRGVVGGASLPFAMLNANKRSVSLDLKNPQGRDLLIEMVKRADVLVENFAPGVTERLGLGVEAMHKINPRLVYAQSSGYGQEGLYRDYPAMDLTVQAMSGIMDITGFPEREPVKAGPRCATSSPACISTAASSPRCSTANAPDAAALSKSRCWTPSTHRLPRHSA